MTIRSLFCCLLMLTGVQVAANTADSPALQYSPVFIESADEATDIGQDQSVLGVVDALIGPVDIPTEPSGDNRVPYESYEIVSDNNQSFYVISEDGNEVRSFDATDGKLQFSVSVNGQYIRAIAWSDNHQRLYIGTDDHLIHYIEPQQSEEVTFFASLGAAALSLVGAGDWLVAVDATGAWESHHVFNESGILMDSREWNHYSRVYAWNDSVNRLYYFRDGTSPNDIEYEDIDPDTGLILAQSDSPYHGDYSIVPPILVSPDDAIVLLGSGDLYDAVTLTNLGSVGAGFTTAIWDEQDELLVLREESGQTVLERVSQLNLVVESLLFEGVPQKVVKTSDGYSVITSVDDVLTVYPYAPNDDSDGDGVDNLLDAFPLDPAASIDTDGDGYPDFWNAGMDADDSTTGLQLDAYPNDAACFLPEHGDGVTCDYGSTIPSYVPDQVEIDNSGVVYLLSRENNRIYRWDSVTSRYLNPLIVGRAQGLQVNSPEVFRLHESHQRLYLGYGDGQITYLSDSDMVNETLFSVTSESVRTLIAAGDFLIASRGYHGSDTLSFDVNGAVADHIDYGYASLHHDWNPVLNRFYHFRDGISPNDILYREIDPVTGQFVGAGESPYHGGFIYQPPIRVSADGSRVVIGSGNVYDASSLQLIDSVAPTFTDARWSNDGELVTISDQDGQTVLRRRNTDNQVSELLVLDNSPIRILARGDNSIVVTQSDQPEFSLYTPSDDSDGDGVPNDIDAFPIDPAASEDSDGDGYPDRWNPRQNEDSSTTGLTLDAYPNDSACYLEEHGLDGPGSRCDLTATMPAYVPETTLVDHSGVVYLFSPENKRIYRWNQKFALHMNPIIIGQQSSPGNTEPNVMAYSEEHGRLYVGYQDGSVTYIGLKGAKFEQPFATAPGPVQGLAAVGDYLLVQDPTGAWNTHHIFDEQGNLTDSQEWNRYSRVYAWNDVLSRVYFFRDGTSPNDLEYEDIDQSTGLITASGDSPYHGDYSIRPPIRVSADGLRVMLGSGDVYDAESLDVIGAIAQPFHDGLFTSSGGTITIRETADNNTSLERVDENGQLVETALFAGRPTSIVHSNGTYTIVTDDVVPQFYNFVENGDIDADGVSNSDDAFPTDPAASIDSDGDGYPDSWNPGASAADSTTGLLLDAYPDDTSCYLPEHGDGVSCDYSLTIPDYLPDQTVMDELGMVYLLSRANARVYRWNVVTQEHEDAVVTGNVSVLDSDGPATMAYSSAHGRLYFGYDSGRITYVDTASSDTGPDTEQVLMTLPNSVQQLASAGNYVFAQVAGGSWAEHHVFDADGTVTDSRLYADYSPVFEWNSALSRLYYFDGHYSNSQFRSWGIDQNSGLLTNEISSPYGAGPGTSPPIRFSMDGTRGFTGAGDLFDAYTLGRTGGFPFEIVDGRWSADNGTVLVRNVQGTTTVERRVEDGALVETVTRPVLPLGLFLHDNQYLLVTHDGQPQFEFYVPNNDTDGDGVDNLLDAFPLDPAASVDSDGDGYPDAWNDGYTEEDSTTGLMLDAYPDDSACYLPGHGDGEFCDYSSTLPEFAPTYVLSDNSGLVYLLSPENFRVYVWDSLSQNYTNPIVVGDSSPLVSRTPDHMAYSAAHNRLYFGYFDGAITYVDLGDPVTEHYFASLSYPVQGLASAGNFVLAQDIAGAWESHHIFNIDGVLTDSEEWNHYSRTYGWSESLSRIFFFRDTSSPNDLHYEVIDQATGLITEEGETQYHGDYFIAPPIRVSPAGDRVLLGSGDLYDAQTLVWGSSFPDDIVDMQWTAQDSVVLASHSDEGNSVLVHREVTGQLLETREFAGAVTSLLVGIDEYIVVTQAERPEFDLYVPNDDSDGDGVVNTEDAFPLDPAASIDTDGDGYPDSWNDGMGASDSTTGLVLDAYPSDSACYLPSHGDGVVCDYSATLPDFVPEQTIADGSGNIYMLSRDNYRVYVWNSEQSGYVNPIVIGNETQFAPSAPLRMAYSSAHNRIYFGYASGELTYVDLANPVSEEFFASLSYSIGGLASAGEFILAQDAAGAWDSHHIFDVDGNLTDSEEWNHDSVTYAWNEHLDRIYFFAHGLSYLAYETVDQVSGEITAEGQAYSNSYQNSPPIRVSVDGTRVLLGSGAVYDAESLQSLYTLANPMVDMRWLPDGSIVSVRASGGGDSVLERRGVDGTLYESLHIDGMATGLMWTADSLTIAVQDNRPEFLEYVPSDDSDGDGVANLEDDFPTDIAASLDTDRDGYPDTWNAGYTQDDSTTGLSLDAFPVDSACQLPEHGDGSVCDVEANTPDYLADVVVAGADNSLLLFSSDDQMVYRWNMDTQRHMNPLSVGTLPGGEPGSVTTMAYSSSHERLYLVYESGVITYNDAADPYDETVFLTGGGFTHVEAFEDYLFIASGVGSSTRYSVYSSAGELLGISGNNDLSAAFLWQPAQSRMLFLDDDYSPSRLLHVSIDTVTGEVLDTQYGPYYGYNSARGPIRQSPSGEQIVLGSGIILDAVTLESQPTSLSTFVDFRWLNDEQVIGLVENGFNSQLVIQNLSGSTESSTFIEGVPVAVFMHGEHVVSLTRSNRTIIQAISTTDDAGESQLGAGEVHNLTERDRAIQDFQPAFFDEVQDTATRHDVRQLR